MRKSIIVLTSLLTWSIAQFSIVGGTAHALTYEYSASPPTAVAVEPVPQPLAYWQLPTLEAEGQTCAFQVISPIHSEKVWEHLTFVTSFACLAAARPMRWGMNRASVVSNMPHASACSLEGITHLRGQRRLIPNARKPRTWFAQLSSPAYPDLAVPAWSTASAVARAHTHPAAIQADLADGYQTVSHGPNPEAPSGETAPTPENPSPGYWGVSPLPTTGLAMYYNPGVMQRVVNYRLGMGEIEVCEECVGYAALLRAGDINRKIWIQWSDGTLEGPFLVVDVAARHHVDMLIRRGWAVDVDYETAMRREMFGPVPVTIYGTPPALTYTPPVSE